MALFSLGLVLFAPFIYRILGASDYIDTVNVFRILVLAEFFNFLVDVYCLYFALEIKTWKGTIFKAGSLTILLVGFLVVPYLHLSAGWRLPFISTVILISAIAGAILGGTWALIGERRYIRNIAKVC